MRAKQFAVGFGIVILLPLLAYYSVALLSPPPDYSSYYTQDVNGMESNEEKEKIKQENERRKKELEEEVKHYQTRGFTIDIVLVGDPDFPRREMLLKRITSVYDLVLGQSRTITAFGAAIPICERPGPAYICARVDLENRIAEANETNNVACTLQIRIRGNGTVYFGNST